MLYAQLADQADVVGRLLAIEQLSGRRHKESLAKPRDTLNHEVREERVKFLDSQSYRNELASAAISALRLQDEPPCVAPLLETLARREADFTSDGFARGLETLAYLARNEAKKDRVRDFLVARVNDRRRRVQLASINALGTLGDPTARGVLEKVATASKTSPQRAAAERAAASLRAGRTPVDDFKNLRQDVLDLQKESRELRKEIDDLKKRIEASHSAPVGVSARQPAPPAPPAKPAPRSPKSKGKRPGLGSALRECGEMRKKEPQ
jgi:HEAT repeat protein